VAQHVSGEGRIQKQKSDKRLKRTIRASAFSLYRKAEISQEET
jgi:hypothetical protein